MYQTYFEESASTRANRARADVYAVQAARHDAYANRVVVGADGSVLAIDGVPNDWHFRPLHSRAMGRVRAGPMSIVTCPSADARISPLHRLVE